MEGSLSTKQLVSGTRYLGATRTSQAASFAASLSTVWVWAVNTVVSILYTARVCSQHWGQYNMQCLGKGISSCRSVMSMKGVSSHWRRLDTPLVWVCAFNTEVGIQYNVWVCNTHCLHVCSQYWRRHILHTVWVCAVTLLKDHNANVSHTMWNRDTTLIDVTLRTALWSLHIGYCT